MTVEEMLNRMSSMELTYWQAFYSLEMKDKQDARNKSQMKANLRGKSRRGF